MFPSLHCSTLANLSIVTVSRHDLFSRCPPPGVAAPAGLPVVLSARGVAGLGPLWRAVWVFVAVARLYRGGRASTSPSISSRVYLGWPRPTWTRRILTVTSLLVYLTAAL